MDLTPALAIIKEFEGCKLEAYQDQRGIWTIGWGTTFVEGEPVCRGMTCTQDQADGWMVITLQATLEVVQARVTAPLNDNQFCALTSLAYNIGQGSFSGSTLLKLVNEGAVDYLIQLQFMAWDHVNGAVSDGLARRRAAESALYFTQA